MLLDWQQQFDEKQKVRVRQLGLLTGLQRDRVRGFRPANFERGLVLQRLVALRRPGSILELGTGRGFGVLSIADAVRAHGLESEILTIDRLSPTNKQPWPIEIGGGQQELEVSLDEIWEKHVDIELRRRVKLRTGNTLSVLPALFRQGRLFELIFIDAGHDLYSVMHDLTYAVLLLAQDGVILMDNYAPLEDFGIGVCIAAAHARRWFGQVEIFPTEGLVYGGALSPDAPRGMVFLKAPREGSVRPRRAKFAWWRLASAVLERCYRPSAFPLFR